MFDQLPQRMIRKVVFSQARCLYLSVSCPSYQPGADAQINLRSKATFQHSFLSVSELYSPPPSVTVLVIRQLNSAGLTQCTVIFVFSPYRHSNKNGQKSEGEGGEEEGRGKGEQRKIQTERKTLNVAKPC